MRFSGCQSSSVVGSRPFSNLNALVYLRIARRARRCSFSLGSIGPWALLARPPPLRDRPP